MPKCAQCGLENVEGTPICRECGATLSLATDAEVADVSADDARVVELIREGKKIAAIKVYRECHGVGLAEAKAAVETLAEGGTPATEASPEEDDDVLELMRGQKKIAAIKIYRERYDVGLKEAKDAVEALAAKHGIESQGGGCAGVVLLGLMGLAAGAWSLLA
jgi:ribosomal protein L7/L12